MAAPKLLELYPPCTCCGGFEPTAQGDPGDNFDTQIERLAQMIRQQGAGLTHDAELLHDTAGSLMQNVVKGFGTELPSISYDTPDFEMLRHLQQNVYHFSAAKNYNQLRDMTQALGVDGRLRTESEYRAAVEAMNIKYNRDWMATERTTAIAGGQMASRWVDFQQNADTMPMLQYQTVGDGNVRKTHRALDGVTRAIDDDFWKSYYPPNGYRCRCDVIQLTDARAEPTRGETAAPEVPAMFQTNLAEQGLIFPKGHPYFDGVPKAELRKAMAYLPPENSYKTVKVGDKRVDLHLMHNDHEVPANLKVADDLMKLGYKKIKLLPDLHEKEAALKTRFYPQKYKPSNVKKNADAWMQDKNGGDMVCDFKTITGERSFSTHITKAAQQAEYAVIKMDFEPQKLYLSSVMRRVELKLAEHETLKGVIVLNKDGGLFYEKFR